MKLSRGVLFNAERLECDLERGVMKMAKLRKMLTHPRKGESGQGALAIVIILLMLGAIILTPLLVFMSTGLKAGGVYESKVQEFYAADAGIEDGLWQIKYDHLDEKFTSPAYPDYDPYDYTTNYSYQLSNDINNENVNVNITNVWIPSNIATPNPAVARSIIESGTLIVTGKVINFPGGARGYEIKISYSYQGDDPNGANLHINDIGVWLSGDFHYVPYGLGSLNNYDSSPDSVAHCGGEAIVWDVDTTLKDLPGGTSYPLVKTLDFQFTGPAGQSPNAVSWITTTGVSAIPYSWDADSEVYNIASTAGSTTAESYVMKSEMRKLASAISGDYVAIGATLMTSVGSPYYPYYRNRLFRESSATVQSSEPEDPGYIPEDTHVDAAFLYWSGWIEKAPGTGLLVIWGVEDCNDFAAPIMGWTAGSAWDTYNGQFRGTAYNKANPGRNLTMSSTSIDLSAYVGQTVEVSWQQSRGGDLEDGDRLYFALSADGGSTWSADIEAFRNDISASTFHYTIPDAYLTNNFRMRFYLYGFSERSFLSTEYCYIDNIEISVVQPLVENAKVNRVSFNGINVTADPDDCQVELTTDSGARDSWSYSCFYDVTNLELGEGASVKALIEEEMRSSGSGSLTFTLGHVLEGNSYSLYPSGKTSYPLATPALSTSMQYQWTYAGWSLIVIYSSPETKGHQLYLFDDFHYVGAHVTLDFPISGFLAPNPTAGSHLTYFVGEGDDHYTGDYIEINGDRLSGPGNPADNIFNSYSNAIPNPTFKSGIDIDTFDMSAHIDPGDTSADVTLGTGVEIYNLVYIILSFRSEITTGGTISYLIR
jgi:hypothetical protein